MSNNFKQTAIGEIPEDWDVVKLDQIADITDGSHFSPKLDETGNYRIATVANIKGNSIDVKSCKKISKTDYELLVKNGCKPEIGDILFSKDGTVGLSFSFKQQIDLVLLSSIAIIRPQKDLNSDYCSYVLKSPIVFKKITNNKRGTGLKRVILRDLKSTQIPLPPTIHEQQKIAEVLSTTDNAIQKTHEIIQKTQLLKNGLLHHLLTRGIGHNKFKQTEIGEIPEEWEYGIIENFANTIGDSVQTGPFGAQLHASDYVKDGVPLILIKNVFDGKIVDEDMPRISHKKAEELSRYRLKIGDIVFSRVGSVGRAAVVREREEGWLISGQMLRVRLDNPRIENVFLGHVINTKWFKKALESKTVGATRKSINTNILRSLPLIVPPLPEQQKIAEILSTVDKKIELEMKRKGQFEQIKQGLMNDLLTGKKRLN
jgi:type I restriction enzyme S subunit